MIKPYNNEILNRFDRAILQLIIFVAILPVHDDFDSPLVIITSYLLVILPLVFFIALALFLHKDNVKKLVAYFSSRSQTPNNADINNDTCMKEFNLIIDDNARQKAKVTICHM